MINWSILRIPTAWLNVCPINECADASFEFETFALMNVVYDDASKS